MKREEHKEILNNLLKMATPEKQAEASSLLDQLRDDYEETLTNFETASTNISELTKNNETLRKVNAELFLKVGTTTTNSEAKKTTDDDDIKILPFDDLFNEKGELI